MKKALLITVLLALSAVLFVAGVGPYIGPETSCLSCHEIQAAGEMWAQSSHRETACVACHGTRWERGWHSILQDARRLAKHFTDVPQPDLIRLSEEQVGETAARCQNCHEREYAGWLSSGHSASYADLFLNASHNRTVRLSDECLRCHGMFYTGAVNELIAPIDTRGPWRLLRPEIAERAAIPCLACHELHRKGVPSTAPEHVDPKAISYRRSFKPHLPGLYDRREQRHFDISLLPMPPVRNQGTPLQIATDPRQRLCYQCHAPAADHEAGSADDRTPRGVHAGLSCLSCHQAHSMEARRSCSECHPRLSNCGLDVEKMETTYLRAESPHNIHWVACTDCHVSGVPSKRNRPARAGN